MNDKRTWPGTQRTGRIADMQFNFGPPVTTPTHYRGVPVPPALDNLWEGIVATWWRAGVDAKANLLPFEVLPGQVYADNDYRRPGRTLRVNRITNDGLYAICTVLTNYSYVQDALDSGSVRWKDMRKSETAIKIRRLYPNARGYALIDSV